MAGKGIFSLVSLILVAGGVLFMIFILLAGAIDGSPVNRWYLLEADTSAIPGAPPLSRWTYWNVCGVQDGVTACGDEDYSDVHPAYPLDPASHRTFDTEVGVPQNFLDHHNSYFLMTRFMFAFMLVALFFGVMALFSSVLALCTRIGSYLSGFLALVASFFQAINAALMTAAYVRGRDAFRDDGYEAHIGQYAFGFQWAALVCYFIAAVLFCVGPRKDRDTTPRGGFFKGSRSRSTRSRGSFVHDKEYGS
ncbi:hypothetical protein PV10_09048 [Exophiala mesophila]|uniref:Protein SUR7 n=1 Tax=Exophiala mesophila TaxID=212818 RepID=A0A0D1Z2I4_EXOME|nr:uncharacterized protein PV10_09048 [Exophiala mesophila]KIV88124.1 hypothetical protein PV10_09048 [Exophiala mesophila]